MVSLVNTEAGSSKHMDHFSMIKVIIKKKIFITPLVFWDGHKNTLFQTESNNRREKMIKIREEMNETENRKTMEKINKTKS